MTLGVIAAQVPPVGGGGSHSVVAAVVHHLSPLSPPFRIQERDGERVVRIYTYMYILLVLYCTGHMV